MQITCPSCRTALPLGSSFPAEGFISCPQCGHKFRVVIKQTGSVSDLPDRNTPEPDVHTPTIKKKKTKVGKSSRPESFSSFFLKAGLAIVGLAVLMVLGYIGIRWLSTSAAAPGEFSKKLTSAEGQLRFAANQWAKEIEQDPDKAKVIERTLARIGFVQDELRKLDPPSDGKTWYDAVVRMGQTLEKFARELDRLRTAPRDEAEAAKMPLALKMDQEMSRLQAEVDAAKKAFNEKHDIK